MSVVGLRELRQRASELIRQAEAGEEVTITVSGRPSVRLVAVAPRSWRTYDEVFDLFDGPADTDWEHDRGRLDDTIRDPWARP